MHIIGGMTSRTAAGRWLVATAKVAGVAGHRHVGSRQRKACLFMVEEGATPIRNAMALAAGLAELSVVRIIGLVAAGAIGWRCAPGTAGLVAGLTGQCGVRAFERQLGEPMVKLRRLEPHDVRRATLVFGVTGPAFAQRRILHAAVIAMVLTLVRGDFLVTGQAQRGLRAHV